MTNEKIIDLAQKIRALEQEIEDNARILGDYREELEHLLMDRGEITIQSKKHGLQIIKEVTTKTSFNSKSFNKERKKEYQDCRKTSLRFDQKLVQEKYPDLYDEYLETITNEIVRIESYEPTLDLDELPEF